MRQQRTMPVQHDPLQAMPPEPTPQQHMQAPAVVDMPAAAVVVEATVVVAAADITRQRPSRNEHDE